MPGSEFEALERKHQMLNLIRDHREEYIRDEQIDPRAAAQIGLYYGEPYYFDGPICDPLLKGATEQFTQPWRLIPEVIPAPQGFFWFDKAPSSYSDIEGMSASRPIPLRGCSWTIFHLNGPVPPLHEEVPQGIEAVFPMRGGGDIMSSAGILLQFYSEINPGMIRPMGFCSWRFGRTQLEIVNDEFKRMGRANVSAADLFKYGGRDDAAVAVAFQFISQKLLSLATFAHPPRAVRKRLEREFAKNGTVQSVRVVTLRSRERLGYIPPEEHQEVAWTSAWWVGAHWRMNHCMRPRGHATGDCWHQPTYIRTHVKGPDDAPIKPPPITLYKVER